MGKKGGWRNELRVDNATGCMYIYFDPSRWLNPSRLFLLFISAAVCIQFCEGLNVPGMRNRLARDSAPSQHEAFTAKQHCFFFRLHCGNRSQARF